MRRLALLLVLAGCTLPPLPKNPTALRALVLKITDQDIATTIQIANSVKPPDRRAIVCAEGLQVLIPQLVAAPHTFIPPTGAASTLETLRIGVEEASGGVGLTDAEHEALDLACAPVAVHTAYLLANGLLHPPITPNAMLQMLLALAQANL